LPDVTRSLDGRKCFFTDRNNYFVVELPDTLPTGFEYWIFFDVRAVAEPDAVLLFIQSAYAGDTGKSPPQPKRGKGPIQDAGEQGAGRTTGETAALKSKPRHWGGVRTPILLIIPLMVWTLSGGQTRFRLWRHGA
jgi:hypothetical protein